MHFCGPNAVWPPKAWPRMSPEAPRCSIALGIQPVVSRQGLPQWTPHMFEAFCQPHRSGEEAACQIFVVRNGYCTLEIYFQR